MPTYHEKKHLPFTADELFDLISDVGSYPEFLPWCVGARVYNRASDQFDADLVIGFKMFREKFTSRVTLNRATDTRPGKVYVDYLRGPMRQLYNHWLLYPQEDGSCLVDFDVRFQFKNIVLDNMIGGMFSEATALMVQAFEDRAHELYGH